MGARVMPPCGLGRADERPIGLEGLHRRLDGADFGHARRGLEIAVMLDGRKVDVSHQAAWQSDTPATATVSDTGLVHGVKAGAAKLTATLFGVSGQGNVTVS